MQEKGNEFDSHVTIHTERSESMLIRERTEQTERNILSPRAAFADEAERGRKETEDPIRTAFQRDRDRILHSNSFRRLKHKTQVYIAPKGDHYIIVPV